MYKSIFKDQPSVKQPKEVQSVNLSKYILTNILQNWTGNPRNLSAVGIFNICYSIWNGVLCEWHQASSSSVIDQYKTQIIICDKLYALVIVDHENTEIMRTILT